MAVEFVAELAHEWGTTDFRRMIQLTDQALKNGGANYAAGRDVYTLGIFGTPSATSRWMVPFEQAILDYAVGDLVMGPSGGDLTMHAHTAYRDPTNECGQALRGAP